MNCKMNSLSSRAFAGEEIGQPRIKVGRFWPAVAINHRRQRTALGVSEAKRHVAVLLRILRGIGGGKKRVEGRRRLDRIEPVALVDRGALGDQPAAGMALQAIEEARARGQIDIDAVEFLPHPDDDAGLCGGGIAIEFYGRRKQMMARPGMAGVERGAAALDELLERPAEPGHGNVAVGRERRSQIFPLALIAGHAPGLDQFRAGDLVGEYGGSVGQVLSPSSLMNDRTIPTSMSSSANGSGPKCRPDDRLRRMIQ